MLKFTATLLLLAPVSLRAEVVGVGEAGEFKTYVDTSRVEDIRYPIPEPPGPRPANAPPSTKVYKQTWASAYDGNNVLVGQYLWVFDCRGRAAQLAVVDARDPNNDYDLTAQVLRLGVTSLLKAIPPISYFKFTEPVVCKMH